MKKAVFTLLFLAIGFSGIAQEKSYEEKTIHLIQMTSGQQFDVMTEPLIKMVPEANQKAFKKDLMNSMGDLYQKMAKVYMESFSEAEIDEILAFYDTPVGKKMVAETPKLTQKAMEIGQVWGMELQPLMAKYAQ